MSAAVAPAPAAAPAAPPANAAPAPGAALPAENDAPTPDHAADPAAAADGRAPLSTASLEAALRAEFTGQKPTTPTTPAAGQEPSPADGQPIDSLTQTPAPAPAPGQTPEDPEDDREPEPAGAPPEIISALRKTRAQRKELKAQNRALMAERDQLKARLAGQAVPPANNQPQTPPQATPPGAPPADSIGPASSPELDQAQKAEADHELVRNWARASVAQLREAIDTDGDTAAVVARLQTQAAASQIQLPDDARTVLGWLERVQVSAEDKLRDARDEVRFLRREVQRQNSAVRSEGEVFAREYVPRMFQPDTEEAQRFAVINERLPGIAQHPLGMRFIAAAVRGWAILKAEIDAKEAKANGHAPKPANGQAPRPAGGAALPSAPRGQLPTAPALVPARPPEGNESSSAVYARYVAATNNPAATEQERERLKSEWVKAAMAGR